MELEEINKIKLIKKIIKSSRIIEEEFGGYLYKNDLIKLGAFVSYLMADTYSGLLNLYIKNDIKQIKRIYFDARTMSDLLDYTDRTTRIFLRSNLITGIEFIFISKWDDIITKMIEFTKKKIEDKNIGEKDIYFIELLKRQCALHGYKINF